MAEKLGAFFVAQGLLCAPMIPLEWSIDHCMFNSQAPAIYLLDLLNFREWRIGFIGKPHLAPSCIARAAGYRDALFGAQVDQDASFYATFDPSDDSALAGVLKKYRPDGIVCSNDHTAAQILRGLTNLKVQVPQKVRLVAFDDVKYANPVSVPVTTIHQPCARIGAAAVQAMLQRIEDPQMPSRDIYVDFHLVIRQSCGVSMDSR